MKRVVSTWVLLLVLFSPFSGSSPGAVAQIPVATADPFALPINHRILRMTEGNGYAYATNLRGGLVYENVFIVNDGVVHEDILDTTRAWYEDHDIQDLYLTYTRMFPDDMKRDTSGIAIQIRLATLPDTDAAAQLVPDTLVLMFMQQREGPGFAQEIVSMEDVPDHDQAIIGVTGTDVYYGVVTGDPAGFRAPFTRFIAQSGTTVASIKVTSLDPLFNDTLARQLLAGQLECLAIDVPCVPTPLPTGMDFEPVLPSPEDRVASVCQPIARSHA
jgi:hypothetical protein